MASGQSFFFIALLTAVKGNIIDPQELIPIRQPAATWGIVSEGYDIIRANLTISDPELTIRNFLETYHGDIEIDEETKVFLIGVAQKESNRISYGLKNLRSYTVHQALSRNRRLAPMVFGAIAIGLVITGGTAYLAVDYLKEQKELQQRVHLLEDEMRRSKVRELQDKINFLESLKIISNITQEDEYIGLNLVAKLESIKSSFQNIRSMTVWREWVETILLDYTEDILRALILLKSGVIDYSLWSLQDQEKFLNNYLGSDCVGKFKSVCPTFDLKINDVDPDGLSVTTEIMIPSGIVRCPPMIAWRPVYKYPTGNCFTTSTKFIFASFSAKAEKSFLAFTYSQCRSENGFYCLTNSSVNVVDVLYKTPCDKYIQEKSIKKRQVPSFDNDKIDIEPREQLVYSNQLTPDMNHMMSKFFHSTKYNDSTEQHDLMTLSTLYEDHIKTLKNRLTIFENNLKDHNQGVLSINPSISSLDVILCLIITILIVQILYDKYQDYRARRALFESNA